MSKVALKKALGELSKEEIIETVCELYDVRKEAKEYLDYWCAPDPAKCLEEYKAKVSKMFFYSSGKNRSRPSATELKLLVRHFSTLVFEPEKVADLLLYICECQYIWVTRKRGGLAQTESAARRVLGQAREYIEEAGLDDIFGLRLERLSTDIDDFYRDVPKMRRRGWRWW